MGQAAGFFTPEKISTGETMILNRKAAVSMETAAFSG
jgi:hypothetical protein